MSVLKNKPPFFTVLFLILIIFLLICFVGLGRSPLYDWDEGIYAQVSRETKILSPYWNGRPWFEKPPLVFWLTKASLAIFGENEFGARFFMPILGTTTLIFFYLLARERLGDKAALLGLTFFLVAPLFMARSQGLNTDMALLAGVVASLFFLTKLEKKLIKKEKINFTNCFYPALMISLAVLAKGLMGFLPGLIWFVYLFIYRRGRLFKDFKVWLRVGIITIVLVAPWHIYQTIRFGNEFWQVYLIEHIFRRAHQPIEYHFGGKLYYIKFLISEFSWWLIPAALGGFYWLFEQINSKKKDNNFVFFLVWGGVVLTLFTFSKTKLFWYILPLYPVLAVLWGYGWQKTFSFGKNYFLIPLIFILFWVFLNNYQAFIGQKEITPSAKNILAKEAKVICPPPLLFLVNQNERNAAEILPDELTLTSSFSYGGSPSVVFYYARPVNFFYQTAQFEKGLAEKSTSVCAMITNEDYQNLGLNHKIINQQKEWLLIK
ncbi:MAG: ArnT family glycosyltransferase [Patescibacteria group bacterium]|jgi:4-amino-4-deoxy-L-arabinose transferase-like glycosyltransferase